MRHSHFGLLSLAGLVASLEATGPLDTGLKPKRRLQPSGQPIPEGRVTRQQLRAEARRAAKDCPS